MKLQCVLVVLVAAVVAWHCGGQSAEGTIVRFVAPTALGDGNGTTAANAAAYTSSSFWNNVKSQLNGSDVAVQFVAGSYTQAITLSNIGNDDHHLTLVGDTAGGTVFNPGSDVTQMFVLESARNATVQNLHFTGNHITEYAFRIRGTGSSAGSRDILVQDCSFIDLRGVYYGATGTATRVYNVTFRNNTFDNVGVDAHAHMIYNAYTGSDIIVEDNYFRNCTGDYVRFRDDYDFGVVRNNTFISTGSTFNNRFVCIPLFNDVNPGDEFFATNYQITGNSFNYYPLGGTRETIAFYHSGYDPTDPNNPPVLLHHLMTAAEGAILTSGTTQQVYDLLLQNTLIDGKRVFVNDNTYSNVAHEVRFGSYANYGAVSKGWTGIVDIDDIVMRGTPDLFPTWSGATSGNWNDPIRWSNANRPDLNREIAVFGPNIAGASSVSLDTTLPLKGMRFNSTHKYTLTGSGSLILEADSGHSIIDVQAGSHEMHLPLTLNSHTDVSLADGASLLLANTLNLNNKTLKVAGPGTLALAGTVQLGDSTINLQNNCTLAFGVGYVNLTAGSTLSGAGTVNGIVINNGRVSPGESTGQLLINGSFGQGTTGELDMELTYAGHHDSLTVLGVASLGGKLKLTLLDGYVPSVGTRFTIVGAQSIVGRFATIEDMNINSNLSLAVTYTQNFVQVIAAIPGDANLDGTVNLADLQILGDHWSESSSAWESGDFNGDGKVNLTDLQILGDHWGYGTSPDLAFDQALQQLGAIDAGGGQVFVVPIPEPGAGVVLQVLSSAAMLRPIRRCTKQGLA